MRSSSLPHTTTINCSRLLSSVPAKRVVWPLMECFGDGLFSKTLGGPVFDHLSPHSWNHCNFTVVGWRNTPEGVEGKNYQRGQPNPVAKSQFAVAEISPAQIPFILIFEFESYLHEPGRTSIVLLLELNSFAYFRSNEPKQKGIFFQWFVFKPVRAVVHTMHRSLLAFRVSLSVAYCLFCYPEPLYCPGSNPKLMLTIRPGRISFLKQQLMLNNCHDK